MQKQNGVTIGGPFGYGIKLRPLTSKIICCVPLSKDIVFARTRIVKPI